MIDYDLEEIYLALLDLIRVKEPHNQTHTKEEALLALGGLKFDLESKKKERIEFDREISSWSARFQINRKLYACGGKRKVNRVEQCIADLFSVDYKGRSSELAPMKHKRCALSLSGLPAQLIALGGSRSANLNVCERYFVSINKWTGLPSLNTARYWPGSTLLKSMRAFCFCGGLSPGTYMNSIESLQVDKEGEWKTLPLNEKIAHSVHLVGM